MTQLFVNIGNFKVPKSMTSAPAKGATYFLADIAIFDFSVYEGTWQDNKYDRWYLSRGLCHHTKEAAELHIKAMLSFMMNS